MATIVVEVEVGVGGGNGSRCKNVRQEAQWR